MALLYFTRVCLCCSPLCICCLEITKHSIYYIFASYSQHFTSVSFVISELGCHFLLMDFVFFYSQLFVTQLFSSLLKSWTNFTCIYLGKNYHFWLIIALNYFYQTLRICSIYIFFVGLVIPTFFPYKRHHQINTNHSAFIFFLFTL